MDVKETADDRGLVDGHVDASGVFNLAMALFAVGASVGCYFTLSHGTAVLSVVVPAILIAFFYTADPFSLKARGLGDVAIFLCFGPMLAAGVAIVVAGGVSFYVISFSVPVGILTVAILHVNNIRDIEADKKAGLVTLAIILGRRDSIKVYFALLAAAYGLVMVLLAPLMATLRLWFVVASAPWALFLVKCVLAGDLQEMPQRTAQHNLLFGAALTSGLASPMFLARVLLGCLFYLGGVNNIIMWSYMTELVHQKINNVRDELACVCVCVCVCVCLVYWY